MRRISKYTIIAALVLMTVVSLGGCGKRGKKVPDPKSPVVITLWHSYNAVVKMQFDKLVQEFNDTVGMNEGIIIDAKGYGSSDELEEVLYASANRVIGAEPLPDIFSSYPDSAYRLDKIAPICYLLLSITLSEPLPDTAFCMRTRPS